MDGRGVEVVVNLRRIETAEGEGRKVGRDNVSPGVGQLIEDQDAARYFGEDRQEAGGRRRFQHHITGPNCGGRQRREPERIGVENCRSALLSSERLVCLGRRPEIFESAASRAADVSAWRKIARPYFRRKRTVAASQAT
jgi:hypothetical protein